ncbi:AIM24 family protein [Micavibrio aeruginosavorus]|uniref:AIM24 family protein n=1 Tax=Micavibrio aeruginosavorus TaxID=349221 RepID=UPI003F4AF2BC
MATIDTPKASTAFNGPAQTHGFEFRINGAHTPYLELHMQPGQAFVGEAGTLMGQSDSVKMKSKLGDGSNSGFLSSLFRSVMRKIGGENFFINQYVNMASDKVGKLSLAAALPGEIVAIDIAEHGNRIVAQRGSFLAAEQGAQLGSKMKLSLFGLISNSVVMQEIKGEAWTFLNAPGNVQCIELDAGEVYKTDARCLVAASDSVKLGMGLSGGLLTMVTGGEGAFVAKAEGPGTIWVGSKPFETKQALGPKR